MQEPPSPRSVDTTTKSKSRSWVWNCFHFAKIIDTASDSRDLRGVQNTVCRLSSEISTGTFTLKRFVAFPSWSPRYLTATEQIHAGGWPSFRRGNTARARTRIACLATARHAVNVFTLVFTVTEEICSRALVLWRQSALCDGLYQETCKRQKKKC